MVLLLKITGTNLYKATVCKCQSNATIDLTNLA